MERKPVTIRNVLISDKLFLDNLAIKLGSVGDALSFVIEKAKTVVNGIVNTEETDKLKSENIALTEQLKALQAENDTLKQDAGLQVIAYKQLNDQLITCETALAERDAEILKKTLTGSQFICELENHIADASRKIRPFTKRDGFIDKDVISYPNALANIAIKQFINRHYSDYLK